MKYILLTLTALFTLTVSAQTIRTSCKVTEDDFMEFLADVKWSVSRALDGAAKAGKLPVYSNVALTKSLSKEEYRQLRTWRETIIIQNPESPDDPYDLVDTTVIIDFDYRDALGIVVPDTGVLEIRMNSERAIYFKLKDARKFLSPADVAVIEYLKAKKQALLDNKLAESTAAGIFINLKKNLYNLPGDKKLPAYADDSLIKTFTKEELHERGRWDEIKFFPQPGTRPEDGMGLDTVVAHNFEPDSIKAIHLLYETATADFNINGTFLALGPGFQPRVAGLILPDQPLFWLPARTHCIILISQAWSYTNMFFTMPLLRG